MVSLADVPRAIAAEREQLERTLARFPADVDLKIAEAVTKAAAIKLSWRNPSMHIERTYTIPEAHDIFRSVRSFMQRLAAKVCGT